MKRAFLLLCLSALMALPAMAAPKKKGLVQAASGQGYGMAGCGLGSILFGEQSGLIQVVAATSNGFAGNQTFGITSGTSNCAEGGSSGDVAALFITANRETLEKEISRGAGESVDSLANVMGCQDSALLGEKLQGSYQTIFPSQKTTTDAVITSIKGAVKSDSELAKSCVSVG